MRLALLISAVLGFASSQAASPTPVSGAGVNAPDSIGFTPLIYATRDQSIGEMKHLLDRGADPNFRTNGITAFNFAVSDVAKASLLIERGFDFKAASPEFHSALGLAARHPRGFPVVKLLLAKGAHVDAEGINGVMPLSRSIFSGDSRIVRALLDGGADPNGRMLKRDRRELPLHSALASGQDEIARLLIAKGADLNASDNFQGHSLAAALLNGRTALARELIERGADLRATKNVGEIPPIVLAAHDERGDAQIVRLLLAKGIDPNNKNDSDETTLHWARKRGLTDLARFLEEKGASDSGPNRRRAEIPKNDVQLTPANRQTLLRSAAEKSLAIMAKGSDGFLDRSVRADGCISCHHQTLPGIAFGWASARKLPINEKVIQRQNQFQTDLWKKTMAKAWSYDDPVPGVVENLSFGLLNLAAHAHPADELTEAMSFFLANTQLRDGGWLSFLARPPMEASRISSSALAVRALQVYPIKEPREATERRSDLARRFFLKQNVYTTDDRVFQLLGLFWSGAETDEISPRARELLKLQRADGGWAQLPTLESDAYATGQALLALFLAEQLPADDPAYTRGIEFLLRTQFEDGSWLVKSRSWPFQAHFVTGFPHGKDQWIAAAGTAYASLALMAPLGDDFPALANRRKTASLDR